MNRDEKKRFVEIFEMSRGERKEHMDELLALIEKYKVLNYASERSDSSSSRRRYRSSGRCSGTATRQAVQWIEELAVFAVERDW